LNAGIDRARTSKGKWTAVEDSQLKYAVRTYGDGDKDWVAISVRVSRRTKNSVGRDGVHRTVRGKEHGTIKKAPALGQDPQSP
jgi:hypothetical protein